MAKKETPGSLQYANDVLNGKIVTNRYVLLAVKRHFDDLKNGHKRGLYFDEQAAERALSFFKFINHTEGEFAGQPFDLSPWQQFIVWNLFGWRKQDGTRRFRYSYVEISRKNGKTTFAAAIALLMMLGDKEERAQVYSAATTRKQAKICFEAAQAMIRKSQLKRFATVYSHNIHSESMGCKFEALSSDADTLDGLNPHCSVIDEYHAHKTAEVYNVMKSGMGARQQPLQFTITTAGFNKMGPCFQLRKTLIEILEGKKQDDAYFAVIYTLDEGDDWHDQNNWIKANPNLTYIPTMMEYLKGEYQQAVNNSTELVNFLTKNLNIWTDASAVWIPDDTWTANQTPVTLEALKGRKCYGGLDLASISDICSLCLFFPNEDESKFDVIWRRWIPEMGAERRSSKDGVAYLEWIRQGYMITTGGNVTDYNWIKHEIRELAEQVHIVSIAYDRFNSSQLVNDLVEDGANMSPFGQGFVSMNAPTKELEKLVLEGKLNHGNDPVARWMCGNVELKRDPAGNIKIDKGKSSEKVDDMVALAMAIGEWLTCKDEPSPYEDRGILFL